MTNLALVDLYIIASISQVVLMFIAVYYAVHIMHKVGTFWAWTLMVVAFGVLALHDFTSVASVLSTPEVQLIAKTEAFTITSYWPGAILNEIAYATMAVATYGLSMVFTGKTVDVKPPLRRARHDGIDVIGLQLESTRQTYHMPREEIVSDDKKALSSYAKEHADPS